MLNNSFFHLYVTFRKLFHLTGISMFSHSLNKTDFRNLIVKSFQILLSWRWIVFVIYESHFRDFLVISESKHQNLRAQKYVDIRVREIKNKDKRERNIVDWLLGNCWIFISSIYFVCNASLLLYFILFFIYFYFKRFYLFIFREKRREGEREGEKHQCVATSHAPSTGDLAYNPACAVTGNQTRDPLVRRPALNSLSHTSQGLFHFLNYIVYDITVVLFFPLCPLPPSFPTL